MTILKKKYAAYRTEMLCAALGASIMVLVGATIANVLLPHTSGVFDNLMLLGGIGALFSTGYLCHEDGML